MKLKQILLPIITLATILACSTSSKANSNEIESKTDSYEIKIKIKDFLWNEQTGLPDSFAPDEVEQKTELVFRHVLVTQRNKIVQNEMKSII